MASDDGKIANLRKQLAELIGSWEPDGCHPPNFVRKTGLGIEVARVDVWINGYQRPHHPSVIGWRAQVGNCSESGMVHVDHAEAMLANDGRNPKEVAIQQAKYLADSNLLALQKKAA